MKKMINKAGLVLAATLMTAGLAVANPIAFTVNATANSTSFDYIAGNSYDFTFVLNEAFEDTGGTSSFGATVNDWSEEAATDTLIFTDVIADGLDGSWTRPTDDLWDPFAEISIREGQGLSLIMDSDAGPYSGWTIGGYGVDYI